MCAGLLVGLWSCGAGHRAMSFYNAGTGDGRSVESGCRTQDISFCGLGLRCAIRSRSRPRPWEHVNGENFRRVSLCCFVSRGSKCMWDATFVEGDYHRSGKGRARIHSTVTTKIPKTAAMMRCPTQPTHSLAPFLHTRIDKTSQR